MFHTSKVCKGYPAVTADLANIWVVTRRDAIFYYEEVGKTKHFLF
jgi:hypothetical protein